MLKKKYFGNKIIIATALAMLISTPVYATEQQSAQQQQQQDQAAQQQAAEQAAQQQQQQQAAEQAAQQQQQQQAAEQAAQQQQQQQAAEQAAQQQQQQQAAEQASQQASQEQQPAQQKSNSSTKKSTSKSTGNTTTASSEASSAASSASSSASSDSSEESEEGALDVSVPNMEISNGKYTLTLKKNANMRVEPSTTADSRIVIPFGITLSSDKKVTNEKGETWYEVTYGTLTGYIREDLADVETIEAPTPEGEGEEGEGGEEEGAAEEASAEAATTEATASTPHSAMTTNKNNEESRAAIVASVTDGFVEYTAEEVEVPKRKKFDFVILLFAVVACIGVAFIIAVYERFKTDFKRLRGVVRKRLQREQRELFQNIEE